MSEYDKEKEATDLDSLRNIAGTLSGDKLEDRLKKTVFQGYSKQSVEMLMQERDEAERRMRDNFERQLSDLSAESTQYSKECEVLRSQIVGIENESKRLSEQFEVLSGSNSALTEENAELRKKVSELSVLTEEYSYQIDKAMVKLKEFDAMAEELKESNDATAMLKKTLVEKERQLEELDRLYSDQSYNKQSMDEIRKENEALRLSYEDMKREHADYTELRDKYSSLVSKHALISEKYDQMVREKSEMVQKLENHRLEEQERIFIRRNSITVQKRLLSEFQNAVQSMVHDAEFQAQKYAKTAETIQTIQESLMDVISDKNGSIDESLELFNDILAGIDY